VLLSEQLSLLDEHQMLIWQETQQIIELLIEKYSNLREMTFLDR
jgi:hypothetical protein